MSYVLKIILGRNNQFLNNQILNHQVVLVVNEINGYNLIKDGVVKFVNININKQKHQIDKKRFLGKKSTRLAYVNKKIRKTCFSMVSTDYNPTEDMINQLRNLKGKNNIKFIKLIVIIIMK